MVSDIVFLESNNHTNTQLVAEMAKHLGYGSIMILNDDSDKANKATNNKTATNTPAQTQGITSTSIQIISNQMFLKKKWAEPIAVQSSEQDRAVLERGPSIMWGFEVAQRKDFTHQRGSGLNHILCEIAHQKNVSILFLLKDIFTAKNPGTIMGRMAQNIRLCQKFKVPMLIGSGASTPYELRAPRDTQALF
ncbi:MAG: RNase P subunit p30 family protein, partial [Candidatus Woesearchaeota archaeon]|nr:RNase P subunit p30 family protein [Candidatus Woesearchaeota archaeon]